MTQFKLTKFEILSYKNQKLPQYLFTIIVGIMSFSVGIHYGWPTPSLPKLLSEEYPLNITSEDTAYITTTSSIGDIIAYILWSILIDLIGRKLALWLTAPPQILSMVLLYFSSHSIIILHAARILGGLAEGAYYSVIPAYICEISEPEIRGILFSLTTVFWCGGILFVNIIGTYCTIETTSLINLSFPIVFFILCYLLPETPFYFLKKDKKKEAHDSLIKLRWKENVEEELVELTKDVNRQMLEKGRYQDLLLVKVHRKALLLGIGIMVAELVSGMTSLSYYAQIFFAEATDTISEDWAASLMIILKLVFSIVSVLIVDTVGRKPLLLISAGGNFLMLTFLAIFFFVKDYSFSETDKLNWLPLMLMILFTIFYNVGLGNLVTWMMGELFSTSVRVKGICVINIIYSIAIFAPTKLYESLADNYSLGIPLSIFALLELLSFVFCWQCVPETKGMTLEEIQTELKNKENKNPRTN